VFILLELQGLATKGAALILMLPAAVTHLAKHEPALTSLARERGRAG
jgi:hypothetical protein